MRIGGYVLDTRQNQLCSDGGSIALSPLAARFLELMGREPGAVVSRTAIVDALWRGDWLVGNPALNRLVSEVRRVLNDDPREPKLIQTVPRCGYRLIAEPIVETARGEEIAREPQPMVLAPHIPPNERLTWKQVWTMANYTIVAIAGSVSLLVAIGGLAHR